MTGLGRGHSLLYYEHISVLVRLCLWTVSFTSVFLPHPRWDRRVWVDWKWVFPFSYVSGLELTVVVYFSSSKWVQFCSVQSLSGVHLFATPWIAACQASLSFTISRSLFKLMSIESVIPSNHLILCHPLLLLPSIFPSLRVFFTESALHIRWPEYWSFSLHQSFQWIFRVDFLEDWLVWSPCSSRDSQVFSNITVQKHQFFSTQPSLWPNSHIHTWPLEKPYPWLDETLLTK